MEYWIWLSLLPYIGPVTANRLLEHFEDPSRVYRAKIPELIKVKGITERQMQSIAENKSLDRIREIMNSCEQNNISVLLEKTRCQVPLNFYKQTNTYLQIVNVVVE